MSSVPYLWLELWLIHMMTRYGMMWTVMVWWEPVNSAIPSNKRGEVSFAALTTLPANLENEKYNFFSIISQSLNSTISLHCSPLNNRSTNWREKDFDLLPWVTKVGTDSRTPCATGIATWNRNQGVANMPMTMKITMIIIWSQRQWLMVCLLQPVLTKKNKRFKNCISLHKQLPQSTSCCKS